MTLAEKAHQLYHDAPAVPRLGVPAFNFWSEGCHGYTTWDPTGATIFPTPLGLGATFNPSLVHKVAVAISDEMRAYHNAAMAAGKGPLALNDFDPNINLLRDPRWGRALEVYGEDPLLMAKLVVAFIRGIQGPHANATKVIATCKHFAAYSVEASDGVTRHNFDARVDARDMAESYLPAFKACITEGRAGSVMCSYNRVNGVPACGNPTLLQDILREQWGFQGYVVSDCGAVTDIAVGHGSIELTQAVAQATTAGCDLYCDDAWSSIPASVESGRMNESAVNTAVSRVLNARCHLGALSDKPAPSPWDFLDMTVVGSARHRELAYQAAVQSMVLLVNKPVQAWGGRSALPLDAAMFPAGSRQPRPWRLAVLGPLADSFEHLLGNYYANTAGDNGQLTPLKAIQQLLSPPPSPQAGASSSPAPGSAPAAAADAHAAFCRYEAHPPAPSASSGRQGRAVAAQGRPHRVSCPAEVQSPVIFSQALESVIPQGDMDNLNYAATNLMARDDVAAGVLFVGGSSIWPGRVPGGFQKVNTENEGLDRRSLRLSSGQEELVKAAARAGKPLVLVLIAGGPLDISALLQLPGVVAVLQAWYPGQEGGRAIADVLFGRASPSGRLPVTMYFDSFTQQSRMTDMSMRAWPGRTYRYLQVPALFRFGHGLSYEDWQYLGLALTPCIIPNASSQTQQASMHIASAPAAGSTPTSRSMSRSRSRSLRSEGSSSQHSVQGLLSGVPAHGDTWEGGEDGARAELESCMWVAHITVRHAGYFSPVTRSQRRLHQPTDTAAAPAPSTSQAPGAYSGSAADLPDPMPAAEAAAPGAEAGGPGAALGVDDEAAGAGASCDRDEHVVAVFVERDVTLYGPDPPPAQQLLAFTRVALCAGQTTTVHVRLPTKQFQSADDNGVLRVVPGAAIITAGSVKVPVSLSQLVITDVSQPPAASVE